jgi:non-ribosomal peptide synthetase component F
MSPKYVAAWRKFNVPLIHIYGLTETTVTSTLHQMPAETNVEEPGSEPPIGRPIANTQLYLLDAAGQPVPTGVVGELHIAGAGLGRGYLNRPGLTAERFLPNPFSRRPGERLYRTGDLARYRNDGNVEFLGRADQQVKIRGFRIELGEIEAALSAHPAVNEAVVIAREDKPGDKRVVAYLVLNGEQTPGTGELRAFVKDKLPDYMVPSAFTILEALPLTPSGKVDRRALPAPERDGLEPVEGFAAPRSPVEETLAHIWAQVLDVERVGIHDNFFHLGGHSLLAIQIVSRVREAFKIDLPLRRIFETPTIADLSVGIVQSQAEELDDELAAELLGALENLSEEEIQSLLPE